MDQIFWLMPGQLAGRAGPNRHPWRLAEIRESGFSCVLSVNDGVLCHPHEFRAEGIDYRCIPLSENAPPRPGDLEHCLRTLPLAFAFVDEHLRLGHRCLVHCTSGKDRTGLFMSYFLIRRSGLSPAEAMRQVKAVRSVALSADGWATFALNVLTKMDQP